MVPNGTAYSNYPPFANNGTKTPPGGSTESAKYALGMVPADTFPAEWANYLFHGATQGITRLNQDTGSIKKELNSVLAAYNIINDASTFDQLLQVFNKLYAKFTNCDTAALTPEKIIAVQGDVLKAGNVYVINMTYGNTYGDGSTTYPTLSVNGDTAYPLCDANGQYLSNGAWTDGDTIKVLFTGSKFLMATRAVTDVITDGDKSPVTSNAVYKIISEQFNIMWPIGSVYTQYPGQKSPNELWTFSTWELLNYEGAFFRAGGGNAGSFDEKSVTAISGAVITVPSHGADVGSLVYDPEGNEARTVTAVSGNNLTLNVAFTSTNLKNVLIGQKQGTAKNGITPNSQTVNTSYKDLSHNHVFYGTGGTYGRGGNLGDINMAPDDKISVTFYTSTAYLNHYHSLTFTPSITFNDPETRPVNMTIKIWKRIA